MTNDLDISRDEKDSMHDRMVTVQWNVPNHAALSRNPIDLEAVKAHAEEECRRLERLYNCVVFNETTPEMGLGVKIRFRAFVPRGVDPEEMSGVLNREISEFRHMVMAGEFDEETNE